MMSPRPLTAILLALALTCCSDAQDGAGAGGDGIAAAGDVGFSGGGDVATTGVDGSLPDASSPVDAAGRRPGDAASGQDVSGTDAAANPCGECFHPAACVDGHCVNPEPGGCAPGDTNGCYGFDEVMTCDATGTAFVPVACPTGETCESGACQLLLCEPDTWICQGVGAKKQCASDGSGYADPIDCPDGEYCADGKCAGSCAPDPKFGAYVGCTFWSVDLPNYPDPFTPPTTPEDLPHALVVSNPGELDTEVSFEPPPGFTIDVADPVVPAGQSRVFMMPVINVSDTGITQSGIRMDATRAVLVHQFNPWDNTFSNDASLLIPEPFLGKKYVVLSWPTSPLELLPIGAMQNQAGYFTVLAVQDNTEVTVQVTANTKAGPGVAAMSPGSLQTVTLNRGEVLNVEANPLSLFENADLSGSTITASKPVAAFGGHEEAVVSSSTGGDSQCCADHLEEQLLPLEVLDSDYVAVKAKPRGGEPDVWRVQAAEAGVSVTTVPSIPGLDGVTLASRGDWVEIETELSFEIHGTGPLQVGQYLVSQGATEQMTGDPSLILAIPAARYRDSYVLMVPSDYSSNWITIIKTPATVVSVGGMPVPQTEFTPIGGGTWEGGYAELQPGVHNVTGDGDFGIVAYGFNSAVSYGYPGGMSAPAD